MKLNVLTLSGVISVGLFMTSCVGADPNKPVQVLAAKKKLSQWTPIVNPSELFEVTQVPVAGAPKNFIPAERIHELKGQTLIRGLEAGAIVSADDLKEIIGFGGVLPPGKRAFALVAPKVTGTIVPGSRVGVIHVRKVGDKKEKITVLRNVLVRAVDGEEQDQPPLTVTVEVSPEEIVKLSQAVSSGTIEVVLQTPADETPKEKKDPKEDAKLKPAPSSPPPATPRTITVWDGTHWRQYSVSPPPATDPSSPPTLKLITVWDGKQFRQINVPPTPAPPLLPSSPPKKEHVPEK